VFRFVIQRNISFPISTCQWLVIVWISVLLCLLVFRSVKLKLMFRTFTIIFYAILMKIRNISTQYYHHHHCI